MTLSNPFSRKVSVFHDRQVPVEGYLAGYGLLTALLDDESIEVPLPDRLALISEKHVRYQTDQWLVFTPRHKPTEDLTGHLYFALKYEGIDLYILKKIFQYYGADVIRKIVKSEPTGQYARRLWFLYE